MASDGKLIFDTEINKKGFEDDVGKLEGLLQKGMGVLTGNIMTAAAGKLVDLGKTAIQTGMSFESAGSQLAATMGKTVDELTSLEDNFGHATINGEDFYGSLIDLAGELGAKTKFTATQAAEGLNILAQSGLNVQDQMAAMPTVLNLAAAGNLDLANAAKYTTGAVKGFGDGMDNAQYYADLMAKGATLANTDVSALGEALSSGAATAASYSQSAENATLALLRLAEQGVTGSAATTALNRAMADLYTPTAEAKKALDSLGVSAYDSAGKAKDVNTVIDELNAAMSGYSEEQKNALKNTIFTAQGLSAFNKMTVTGAEKLEEFREGLLSAGDGMGAAAQQAQTMSDNLEGDLTIMGSAMDGFYNAVYSKMQAPLRGLVQLGTDSISKLTDGLKSGGVEGMIDAGIDLVDGLVDGFISGLPGMVNGLIKTTPKLLKAGGRIVTKLGKSLVKNGKNLLKTGKDIIKNLAEGIDKEDLKKQAGKLLDGFMNSVKRYGSSALSFGRDLVKSIANGIGNYASTLWNKGGELLRGFISKVASFATEIWNKGVEIVKNIAEGIGSKAQDIYEKGKELIEKIKTAIVEKYEELKQQGKDIVAKMKEGIEATWEDFKKAGSDMIDKVIQGVKDKASDLYNAVKTAAQNAWDSLKSVFTGESPSVPGSTGGGGSASFGSSGSGPSSSGSSTPRSNASTGAVANANPLATAAMAMQSSGAYGSTVGYAERTYANSSNIDYDRMGEAVAEALDGTTVEMDGERVGTLITPYVSENLADEVNIRKRGDI